MSVDDIQFPTDISLGSGGGPGFNTAVVPVASGFKDRDQDWDDPLFEFNVKYGVKRWEQMRAVMDFFIVRRGMLYGFRYKNWFDFQATDQPVAVVSTVGAVAIGQLQRRYPNPSRDLDKNIVKPVSGTVVIRNAGNPITPLVVDINTGVITFNDAPDTSTNPSGAFATIIPFVSIVGSPVATITTSGDHGLSVGDQFIIDGTSIGNWDGPTTVLSVPSSTQITATATGPFSTFGNLFVPFQSPNFLGTLDWSGEFDLSTRFDADEFEVTLEEGDISSVSDIPITEIRDFQ